MFNTHAQNKQTNTTLALSRSLSLSFPALANIWASSSFRFLPTPLPLPVPPTPLVRAFRTRCCITTLPRPSACLSWDAQTLWPPRRWSFERVSSWLWGPFRPWRCSSSAGSRPSSCPSRPAPAAGWPSCRWCGPPGRSSSPWRPRAARRPPDRVRYWERCWGEAQHQRFSCSSFLINCGSSYPEVAKQQGTENPIESICLIPHSILHQSLIGMELIEFDWNWRC